MMNSKSTFARLWTLMLLVLLMTLSLSALAAGSTGKAALASPGPGWELRATVPNLFLSVAAFDESTAWASSGMPVFSGIFKTTDGGTTWTLQSTEVFTRASVVDSSIVYACGGNKVLKTIDGGTTWNVIYNQQGVAVRDIHAFDATNAVACGYVYNEQGNTGSYVSKTSNGGETWDVLYFDAVNSVIGDLSAPSPEVIWVVEKRAADTLAMILRTTDGGASWSQVGSIFGTPYLLTEGLFSFISAIDANTAWVLDTQVPSYNAGDILRTTDGGNTWISKYHFIDTLNAVSGVFGIDAEVCWASSFGKALKTVDGGDSWAAQPIDPEYAAFPIDALNPCVAWTVVGTVNSLTEATSVVYRTTDGGDAKPDVVSISPDMGPEGSEVTVKGCDFGATQGTSYVSFGAVAATEYISWSDSQVVVKVPAGITSPAKVTVTTAEGTSNGKWFSTPPPAPTVTSVSPAEAGQFAFFVSLSVEGTCFQPGAALRLEKDEVAIEAIAVDVSSDTQLAATLVIFGNEAGAYDVVVTNPDGGEGKLATGFTVNSACGAGAGPATLVLGLALGLLSLAGSRKARRRRSG
jgi:photosystem II stability/assembly factor-like uncharacterized protein